MAITRTDVEKMLVNRAGKKMAVVSFAVTTNGSNADLNEPICDALLKMGITPASYSAVSDSDLVNVESVPELLDRAELRLLENIAGNIDIVDITVGPRRESLGQLSTQVQDAITRLTVKIEKQYGGSMAPLTAGVIGLDFQQEYDEDGE
jgi:hypothetical protein